MQAREGVLDGRPSATGWFVLAVVVFGSISLSQLGCVSRRLTIRSNPPGAQVYIDNYEIGTTPCSTAFTYYGTRQLRLVKDGYETLTVDQPIPAPWYQIPPIDFVTENLSPGELRDERTLSYTLTPQIIVPTEHLLSRAEQLRAASQSQSSLVAPPATAPRYLGPAVTAPPPPGPQIAPQVQAPAPSAGSGAGRMPPGGSRPIFVP